MAKAVDALSGFAPGLIAGRRIVAADGRNGIGQAIALGWLAKGRNPSAL
jgi:hypothetical protein